MKKRETMEEAAAKRRCPICMKWFMSEGQRDQHLTKTHEVTVNAS